MVLLQLTDAASNLLRELFNSLDFELPKDLREELADFLQPGVSQGLDHEVLIDISTLPNIPDSYTFQRLSENATVFLSVNPRKVSHVSELHLKHVVVLKFTTHGLTCSHHTQSPSYIKLMQDLEAQQAQKDYDRLTTITKIASSNSAPLLYTEKLPIKKGSAYDASQEWKQAKKEISAIINVLASMVAVATATWWACGNALPVKKVPIALFFAMFIGAAEAFLYIRFFNRQSLVSLPTNTSPTALLAKNNHDRPKLQRSVSASSLPRYPPAATTSPLGPEVRPLSKYIRQISRRGVLNSDILRKKAIEGHRQTRSSRPPYNRRLSI